jgi:hypothetical protein
MVAEDQLLFLDDEASDLRTRGLVSESPPDRRIANEAQRSAENARRHRDRIVAEVGRLSTQMGAILDWDRG